MNYNKILQLNVSEDVKILYIHLYETVNKSYINLDELKQDLESLANYNYYTSAIDSNIINIILEPLNENLFSDDELIYLKWINHCIESNIFLDDPIFNYDDHAILFKLLDENLGSDYVTKDILLNTTLLYYDDMLDLVYQSYNVPDRLINYIDDDKLIRDTLLSSNNIFSDAENNYTFNQSTIFLIVDY